MDLKVLQWPDELRMFLQFCGNNNIHSVLEIGTGAGGLAQQLARQGIRVVTVDLPDANDATGLKMAAAMKRNMQLGLEFPTLVDTVMGDSHDGKTIDAVEQVLGGVEVDLLFLDGDDTYWGKTQDYYDYKQFVREGGWFATHDINAAHTGVPMFWKTRTAQSKITFSEDKHWGGIGMWR